MATGDEHIAIAPKRLLGFLDFTDRLFDYFKKRLADALQYTFGIPGAFNTAIVVSANGTDAIQLDNDVPGTDAIGHILVTDAVLAGRGANALKVENTSAVTYYVGLIYTEKPAGIQINPRTGYPEFVRTVETIGVRDEPDAVVNNGSNLTLTVDAIARPYAADVSNSHLQVGRRVLVWKKTPGKGALTEGIAIETCTIYNGAGSNKIDTTALFGQDPTAVSTNASDYFVVLYGATVSRQDLSAEAGVLYLAFFVGGGAGAPSGFDNTGQNVLTPAVSVDLSKITAIHHVTNLKIRVKADASDSGESQLEVQNVGATPVFTVDETGSIVQSGNTLSTGTIQHARAGFGGAPDAAHKLKAWGDAEITDTSILGTAINSAGPAIAAATARQDFGSLDTTTQYNLLTEFDAGGGFFVRVFGSAHAARKSMAITYNAGWDHTSGKWQKDVPGAQAVLCEFGSSGMTWSRRTTDADWLTSSWELSDFNTVGTAQWSLFGSLLTGNGWVANQTDGDKPRLKVGHDEQNDYFVCLFESTNLTSSTRPAYRLYVAGATTGGVAQRRGFALTINAKWYASTQSWNKDDTNYGAIMLRVAVQGDVGDPTEYRPNLTIFWRSPASGGAWNDLGWSGQPFNWILPDSGESRNNIILQDARIEIPSAYGGLSNAGSNPDASVALTNTLVAKTFTKAWAALNVNSGTATVKGVTEGGANIASATTATNRLTVTLASGFPNQNWAPVPAIGLISGTPPLLMDTLVIGNNTFRIDIYDKNGNAVNWSTINADVSFHTHGRQA